MRKCFFTMKTASHWSRLPRELVQYTSLDIFHTRLDKALNNLVWSHRWPCLEQEVGLGPPKIPSYLEAKDLLVKSLISLCLNIILHLHCSFPSKSKCGKQCGNFLLSWYPVGYSSLIHSQYWAQYRGPGMKCSFLHCMNKEVAKWPLLIIKLRALHRYPMI